MKGRDSSTSDSMSWDITVNRQKDGWWKGEAKADGKTVGIIETADKPIKLEGGQYWPIYLVYVDEGNRGKGVAKSLYQALISGINHDGIASLPKYRGNTRIPQFLSDNFSIRRSNNDTLILRKIDNKLAASPQGKSDDKESEYCGFG